MSTLDGASILVIGATGGLGRHIARQLADAGAKLTLSARNMTDLEGLGIPGSLVPGDLTDPNTPRTLVASAVITHGSLDGVVNAAGVVAFGTVAETSDATLDELWTINALAPMRVLRAAAPALEESAAAGRSPFVLTLSGVVSESPTVGLGAYSAVKSALAAYQQVAARELRRSGIRVVDARPGHTETELSRHPIAGETPKFPTGYEPAAVAERIVAALASDEKDLPSSAFTEVPAAAQETVPTAAAVAPPDAHPAVKMAAEMPLEVSASAGSAASVASAHSATSAHSVGSASSTPTPQSPSTTTSSPSAVSGASPATVSPASASPAAPSSATTTLSAVSASPISASPESASSAAPGDGEHGAPSPQSAPRA